MTLQDDHIADARRRDCLDDEIVYYGLAGYDSISTALNVRG